MAWRESIFAKNKTVSIYARWLQLVTLDPCVGENSDQTLDDFVRFLEGRLSCEIPDFWSAHIQTAEARLDGQAALFRGSRFNNLFDFHRIEDDQFAISRDFELSRIGQQILISSGDHQFLIPPEVLEGHDAIYAEIISDGLVVMLPSRAAEMPLFYFDLETENLLWSGRVSCGTEVVGVVGAMTPWGNQELQLVSNHNSILVFGASSGRAYCQEFSIDNGEKDFFFTSSMGLL